MPSSSSDAPCARWFWFAELLRFCRERMRRLSPLPPPPPTSHWLRVYRDDDGNETRFLLLAFLSSLSLSFALVRSFARLSACAFLALRIADSRLALSAAAAAFACSFARRRRRHRCRRRRGDSSARLALCLPRASAMNSGGDSGCREYTRERSIAHLAAARFARLIVRASAPARAHMSAAKCCMQASLFTPAHSTV